MSDARHRSPRVDAFTAKAVACTLLVIAGGFFAVALHALATGCIRLGSGPHGPWLPYCKPDQPYWVAIAALLVLGCVLVLACGKLWKLAAPRPGHRPPGR